MVCSVRFCNQPTGKRKKPPNPNNGDGGFDFDGITQKDGPLHDFFI